MLEVSSRRTGQGWMRKPTGEKRRRYGGQSAKLRWNQDELKARASINISTSTRTRVFGDDVTNCWCSRSDLRKLAIKSSQARIIPRERQGPYGPWRLFHGWALAGPLNRESPPSIRRYEDLCTNSVHIIYASNTVGFPLPCISNYILSVDMQHARPGKVQSDPLATDIITSLARSHPHLGDHDNLQMKILRESPWTMPPWSSEVGDGATPPTPTPTSNNHPLFQLRMIVSTMSTREMTET